MDELNKILDEVLLAIKNDDDEVAHSREDKLRNRALELIATGDYTRADCMAFAEFSLRTNKLKFARWCA